MQSPLVSIIIPTYNRAHLIRETLDSVLAQSYTNWECIVVDDGSTDLTFELLSKYANNDSRFKYYQRPVNKIKGPNSCRNYGFEKSKGNYINFFDSDDIYKTNAFEVLIKNLEKEYDAIIAKVELKDFDKDLVHKENRIISDQRIEDFFIGKTTYFVSGPFWKRSFLMQQDSLFDEEIGNGDDWDFNLRMLYKKPNLGFIEVPLIQIRIHKDSFSKEKSKLNKKEILSDFKALEKHLMLIKNIKNINKENIEIFVINRYNRALKWALFKENNLKYLLLRKLVSKQLKFNYYGRMIRTIIGFILYSVFKKGYKFLKD